MISYHRYTGPDRCRRKISVHRSGRASVSSTLPDPEAAYSNTASHSPSAIALAWSTFVASRSGRNSTGYPAVASTFPNSPWIRDRSSATSCSVNSPPQPRQLVCCRLVARL